MADFNWQTIPELYTIRLILKPLENADIEELFNLRSEPESMKYIGRPLAKTRADAEELFNRTNDLFAQQEGINWAIKLKDDPTMMGTIGFYRLKKEHFRGEVGYQLQKRFLRKGYMSEALSAILEFGFAQMNFHTIEAVTTPENIASRKLLEKHGFIQEGSFKENFFFEGNFYDSAVYSKLSPYPFENK